MAAVFAATLTSLRLLPPGPSRLSLTRMVPLRGGFCASPPLPDSMWRRARSILDCPRDLVSLLTRLAFRPARNAFAALTSLLQQQQIQPTKNRLAVGRRPFWAVHHCCRHRKHGRCGDKLSTVNDSGPHDTMWL
jgi:hypothetical protein